MRINSQTQAHDCAGKASKGEQMLMLIGIRPLENDGFIISIDINIKCRKDNESNKRII